MPWFGPAHTDTEVVGLMVGWSVLFLIYLIGAVWYFTRRNVDVILARLPGTTLIILTVIWINLIFTFVINLLTPTLACELTVDWLYPCISVTLVGLFCIGIWKCVAVIVKYEIQRMRLAVQIREELAEIDTPAASSPNTPRNEVKNDDRRALLPRIPRILRVRSTHRTLNRRTLSFNDTYPFSVRGNSR